MAEENKDKHILTHQERDRHVDHIDSYVAFEKIEGRFQASFEHCAKAMIEVPTHLLLALPSAGKGAEGIRARLECVVCKAALRIEIVPENGGDKRGV